VLFNSKKEVKMAIFERPRGLDLGSNMPHFFFSHSSKDKSIATRIAKNLNTCQVDVWFDCWELRGGIDVLERLSDAVNKSKYVAVIVSKNFDNAKWAKGELHQALSRERRENRDLVIPLLVEDIPLPPVIESKKYFVFDDENYYASLTLLVGQIYDFSA
jgi:hypothetical protein